MQIEVYFKNYLLGSLSKNGNEFVYNSNPEGESLFKASSVSAAFYDLFDSQNKILNGLPSFLSDYESLTKNDFLAMQAQIKAEDDYFTKLYKLSTLNFDDIGFYIKAK